MSNKIKKAKELYHVFRIVEEKNNKHYFDYDETFDTYEKAEKYVSSMCKRYTDDYSDAEESYTFELVILKEVKNVRGEVKVKKIREVILS
jgi:hypothetical protein